MYLSYHLTFFWAFYLKYLLTSFLPFYLYIVYLRNFFVVMVRRGTHSDLKYTVAVQRDSL